MLRAPSVVFSLGLGLLALQPGCGVEPPKSAATPPAISDHDDWKRTAIWLYATDRARGGHEGECTYVYELLEKEARCKGELCIRGAELASEWLEKCSSLAAEQASEVGDWQASMSDRADQPPTKCADVFAELTGEGCEPDSCLERAQRWATDCGEIEAGPLSVLILERALRRKLDDESIQLDTRGCVAMGKLLLEGAHCADEEACKKLLPEVEAYRTQCEANAEPDMATAVAQLAIVVGSAREPTPVQISDESKTIAEGRVPLRLADGSGAILGVCHRKAVELGAYLKDREGCPGARLSVARVIDSEQGIREMRVGTLFLPEGVELTSLYPWLEVTGESEQLAKERVAAAKTEIEAVLAADGDAGLVKLIELVDRHRQWILRSESVAAVLRAHDAKLAPLLERLGQAKAKVAATTRDSSKLRSLLIRAKTRPLADVDRKGAVAVGAYNGGYWLEGGKLWPKAMAAYRAQLEPLEQAVRKARKQPGSDIDKARTEARTHAKACAAALERQREAVSQLEACVFASCDNAERDAAVQQLDQGRQDAARARLQLDAALGPISATASDSPLARKAGCKSDAW